MSLREPAEFRNEARGLVMENLSAGPNHQAEVQGDANPTEESQGELSDFPEIAWRGIFADYREAVKLSTEASDVFHFVALWAVIAVSLGRLVWMYAGGRIYPNIYAVLFGETGDKKTTAQRLVLNCGVLPASIRIIRNLGSTEGLADALKQEDRSDAIALSFWEELTAVLARGRWKGSTILEFITECFDCPPEWGLKYRKEPISIKAPTPTILAGTTQDWFWKNARADDFHGGFGNRFAYFTGIKKAPNPNPVEPGVAALQSVRETLARVNQIQPIEAYFSSTASRLWERFYVEWESKDRPGLYGAATKRVHVYVRKLALAYAAIEGTLPEITIDQLQASIAVGLYAAECARLLVEAQNTAIRPESQIEERFFEWIKNNDGA